MYFEYFKEIVQVKRKDMFHGHFTCACHIKPWFQRNPSKTCLRSLAATVVQQVLGFHCMTLLEGLRYGSNNLPQLISGRLQPAAATELTAV